MCACIFDLKWCVVFVNTYVVIRTCAYIYICKRCSLNLAVNHACTCQRMIQTYISTKYIYTHTSRHTYQQNKHTHIHPNININKIDIHTHPDIHINKIKTHTHMSTQAYQYAQSYKTHACVLTSFRLKHFVLDKWSCAHARANKTCTTKIYKHFQHPSYFHTHIYAP